MTTNEHISRLQEAQELMREALNILRDVASETDSGMAGTYILPHLEILIDDEHPWIGRSYNIDKWINDLQDSDERTPADVAAYEAMQEPATCPACNAVLTPGGTCPNADALDAGEPVAYDGDTEEFAPVWAEVLYDQPSFPHDVDYENFVRKAKAKIGASFFHLWTTYAYDHSVDPYIARSAVRYILGERLQS